MRTTTIRIERSRTRKAISILRLHGMLLIALTAISAGIAVAMGVDLAARVFVAGVYASCIAAICAWALRLAFGDAK